MPESPLSPTEQAALELLVEHAGAILVTDVPDRNERNHLGRITPGHTVYRKLEKKGLVIYTIEDPVDLEGLPGFVFTQMIEITDAGSQAWREA